MYIDIYVIILCSVNVVILQVAKTIPIGENFNT